MVRNLGLLPRASKEVSSPGNSCVSRPAWMWVLQPPASLQVTVGLASILTTTSWNTLGQNHSFNCFSILGPQKLQEDECLLFKLLSFEVISYAAIDN